MMALTAAEFDVQDSTLRVLNLRNLRHVDWLLPLLVLALAVIGWATLYSASRSSDLSYFQKQVLFFCLGATGAAFIVCIDYRFLVAIAPAMYAAAILSLLGVLWTEDVRKGSERWFALGPINLQPSELAKIVMVYSLTWYLNILGCRIRRFGWFFLTFIIVAVPMALILKQPNLGTAACLAPLTVVMLFAAGCRLWHLALVMLLGLMLAPFTWLQLKDFDPARKTEPQAFYELHHHQKARIYSFLHPETDLRESGWQIYQSKITVGSGGAFGKGFLKGTQTRLNYLPEHHTDFIFSLLAEERGFLGAFFVIGLFTVFLVRGLSYARDCPEIMGTLLATGAVTILAFHVFVNISITIGLMPVTGIPLPFLSYGGSFYVTTMACVGILLNVPMRRRVFVN